MRLAVRNSTDVDAQLALIKESAERAARNLKKLFALSPMELFWQAKFNRIGLDPIELHSTNLVEQIHQLWTHVAALEASRILLTKHPSSGAMKLAPGAHKWQPLDIMSEDGQVGAEVFATVHPANNKKLERDIEKLSREVGKLYIFFMSPKYPNTAKLEDKPKHKGVEVWSLEKPTWLAAPPR